MWQLLLVILIFFSYGVCITSLVQLGYNPYYSGKIYSASAHRSLPPLIFIILMKLCFHAVLDCILGWGYGVGEGVERGRVERDF